MLLSFVAFPFSVAPFYPSQHEREERALVSMGLPFQHSMKESLVDLTFPSVQPLVAQLVVEQQV